MPRATSRSDSASVARKSLGFGWEDGLDGAVAVRQTLTAADGVLHFGAPKAKAGERVMPLPPFVARASRDTGRPRPARLWPIGGRSELRHSPSGPAIDNGIGEPYQPASFPGAWRAFAREHGFRGVALHGLRHGAATLLLAAGSRTRWRHRSSAMRTPGFSAGIRTWSGAPEGCSWADGQSARRDQG
jgi:integrase